MNFSLKRVDC